MIAALTLFTWVLIAIAKRTEATTSTPDSATIAIANGSAMTS
ncbi:MAG: hypothetical protein P8J87_14580 [Verrucomicrobiales bacterium]|nr:hypothetical protein [Verrucomicrobiales bacterium]